MFFLYIKVYNGFSFTFHFQRIKTWISLSILACHCTLCHAVFTWHSKVSCASIDSAEQIPSVMFFRLIRSENLPWMILVKNVHWCLSLFSWGGHYRLLCEQLFLRLGWNCSYRDTLSFILFEKPQPGLMRNDQLPNRFLWALKNNLDE